MTAIHPSPIGRVMRRISPSLPFDGAGAGADCQFCRRDHASQRTAHSLSRQDDERREFQQRGHFLLHDAQHHIGIGIAASDKCTGDADQCCKERVDRTRPAG